MSHTSSPYSSSMNYFQLWLLPSHMMRYPLLELLSEQCRWTCHFLEWNFFYKKIISSINLIFLFFLICYDNVVWSKHFTLTCFVGYICWQVLTSVAEARNSWNKGIMVLELVEWCSQFLAQELSVLRMRSHTFYQDNKLYWV